MVAGQAFDQCIGEGGGDLGRGVAAEGRGPDRYAERFVVAGDLPAAVAAVGQVGDVDVVAGADEDVSGVGARPAPVALRVQGVGDRGGVAASGQVDGADQYLSVEVLVVGLLGAYGGCTPMLGGAPRRRKRRAVLRSAGRRRGMMPSSARAEGLGRCRTMSRARLRRVRQLAVRRIWSAGWNRIGVRIPAPGIPVRSTSPARSSALCVCGTGRQGRVAGFRRLGR